MNIIISKVLKYYINVDMCGVEGKRRTLWSKRHLFAPTSRQKTYTPCAVGQ